jgi:hypothetical protein
MSIRKHLQSIALIARTPALLYRVRTYFGLGAGHLFRELRLRRLGQADIVLCLLRIGTRLARRAVEALVGRPIIVAPACRFTYRVNGARPTVGRQPVITRVEPMPVLRKSTRIAECYKEFRVGRTRDQLLARGVSRGDIARAVRRGWIALAT